MYDCNLTWEFVIGGGLTHAIIFTALESCFSEPTGQAAKLQHSLLQELIVVSDYFKMLNIVQGKSARAKSHKNP